MARDSAPYPVSPSQGLEHLARVYLDWTPPQPKRWQAEAACRGHEDVMFIAKNASHEEQAAARAICDSCPVLDTCREWALTQGYNAVYGFVAGMSQRERRRQRKERKEAA